MPNAEKKKILDKIHSLTDNPRPFGYKKLVYYTEYFRVRVGNYRIIYTILDGKLLVVIAEVTDRRDAY
jgi:mRNA interferase RelE/StbE